MIEDASVTSLCEWGVMTAKQVIGVALAVVLVAVAGFFIVGAVDDGGSGSSRAGSAASFLLGPGDGPPRDFLYLDAARTDAYVSQFQGGLATLEKTSAVDTDKRAAALEQAPAKVSREVQAQDSFERQVTPTNASRFINLIGYLERNDDEQGDKAEEHDKLKVLPSLPVHRTTGPQPSKARKRFIEAWSQVREGDFVRLEGPVRLPGFMRLYQTIRQVPPDSAIGKQGKPVLDAVGLDPRFPFTMTVEHEGTQLRLILPAQYSAVATESSLFYGRLTVLGKVIYRIYPTRRAYRDLQTYSRFRPILRRRPELKALLTRLKLDENQLREELLRYRTVKGPAAVVLPVAIYK